MRRLKQVFQGLLCFVFLFTGYIFTKNEQTALASTVKSTKMVFQESSSSASRTQVFTIPNLKSVTSVTIEPSNASFNYTVNGDQVTITAGGGSPTRSIYDSYKYSKYVSLNYTSTINNFPDPYYHSDGLGYSGYVYKNGAYTATNPYRAPDSLNASTTRTQSGSCPSTSSYTYSVGNYSGTLYASGSCYVYTSASTVSQTFTSSYTNTCTSTYKNGVYQNNESCSGSAPSSVSINSNGFVGSIPRTGTTLVSDNGPCTGCTYTRTRVWRADYSGTLSKTIPAIYGQSFSGTLNDPGVGYLVQNYTGYIYSGGYNYFYSYVVKINYIENSSPQFAISSPGNDTVVSNQAGFNTLSIRGSVTKPDAGETVTVKYKIDDQVTPTTLQSLTTTGNAQPFGPHVVNVNPGWTEGSHTLTTWSEDQLGTKSNVITRTFYYDKTAPSAPTGIKSPRQSVTSVDLSWDPSASADVVDYQVFRNGQPLGNTNGITSFPAIGLTENNTYSFTVKAIDRGGNISATSAAFSATTIPWDGTPDTEAPSVPSFLAASEITDSSALLQWAPSSDNFGVMQYEIYDAVNESLLGTSTQTAYKFNHLLPLTAYRIKVKAKDNAGNVSSFSPEYIFTTQQSSAPALLSADPTTGSLQIPLDPTIQLNYSELLLPGTAINSVSLTSGSNSLPLEVRVDGTKLRIIPMQSLSPQTSYTITIPADAVTDLDGNSVTDVYTSTFQTEASGQPDNLVLNGGFEVAGISADIGDEWISVTNTTYGWQSVTQATYGVSASLTSATPYAGDHAQQINFASADNGDFGELSQSIAIGGSTPYEFNARVQLTQSVGTVVSVTVEWLDENDSVLDAYSREITDMSTGYESVSTEGVTPVGTASANVYLRLRSIQANGQGTANFDEVVLKLPDNRKPSVALASPMGSPSEPLVLSQSTPTIQWNQFDADTGTIFNKYQVQAWNSDRTTLYYDSGATSYTGVGNQGSHTMNSALQRNQLYQIRARVFDGINWSDWSNSGWLRIQDVQEPNNTAAEAITAQAFTVYSGTIESESDVDFYKFTPQYTGLYHLTLKVPANVNYDVSILNAAQTPIISGNKSTGLPEEVSFRATAGEVYYVRVIGGNGDNSLQPYLLGISRVLYNYQYNIAGRLMMMNVQKGLHLYMAEYKYDDNGNMTDTDYYTIEVDE